MRRRSVCVLRGRRNTLLEACRYLRVGFSWPAQHFVLQWIFEGLRAVETIPFNFHGFLRILWGHEDIKKTSKMSTYFWSFVKIAL